MRRFVLTIVCGIIGAAAIGCGLGVASDKPAASGSAQSQPSGEFPDSYYYYDKKRPADLRALEGKPAPGITVKDWIGESQDLSKLKGKVVIVDFWATWCPPCRASLAHNVEMAEKHKENGLVIIGIHDSKRGSEAMPGMAKDKGINYPLSVDKDGASVKAYHVTFWPTYVLIDRKGIIRAAGVEPGSVEKVALKLLEEKAE